MLNIGSRICVMGDWDDSPEPEGRLVLRLVPSYVFGTGAHPSTRILLEELETLDLPGRRVLDVGTGTGILALAAEKLGAERVGAIDLSREALAIASINVEVNASSVDLQLKECQEIAGEPHTWDLGVSNLGSPEETLGLVSTFTGRTLLVVVDEAGLVMLEAESVARGWTVANKRQDTGSVLVRLERGNG